MQSTNSLKGHDTVSTPESQPLVRGYLRDLSAAARDLPRRNRHELVAQISEHLAEVLATGAAEAEVRTELDRLGSPEEIAAAERDRLGLHRHTFGNQESFALVTLAFGFLVPLVGLIVGLVLLWGSQFWTRRHKVVASGIIAATPVLMFVLPSVGIWETAIFGVLGGPILAAGYLLVAAGVRGTARRSAAAGTT